MQLRSLLSAYKDSRNQGNNDPQLFRKLQAEHFPDMPDLSTAAVPESLRERLDQLESKRRQLERVRDKLKDLVEQRRVEAGGVPDTSHFEET
jgi:hypothetical protein